MQKDSPGFFLVVLGALKRYSWQPPDMFFVLNVRVLSHGAWPNSINGPDSLKKRSICRNLDKQLDYHYYFTSYCHFRCHPCQLFFPPLRHVQHLLFHNKTNKSKIFLLFPSTDYYYFSLDDKMTVAYRSFCLSLTRSSTLATTSSSPAYLNMKRINVKG